jgi:hypothetical protein
MTGERAEGSARPRHEPPEPARNGEEHPEPCGCPPTWTDLPWGVFVVIAGLLALVGVAVIAILHYSKPADVATAASPFTGVIVGLVGTYFGVRGATQAQQKANEAERLRGPRDRSPEAGGDGTRGHRDR